MRGPDSFWIYHERGASIVRFQDLLQVHINNGCTVLVAELTCSTLVAEGEKEAVKALWYELDSKGQTFNETAGSWRYTGIHTNREGLRHVLLMAWTPWHFDDESRFRFGYEPDVAAARAAATQQTGAKRPVKRAKEPAKKPAKKPEMLDA